MARSSFSDIAPRSEMLRSFRSRAASISCSSSNSLTGGRVAPWGRRRGRRLRARWSRWSGPMEGICGRTRETGWGRAVGSRGIAPQRRPRWERMEHRRAVGRVNGGRRAAPDSCDPASDSGGWDTVRAVETVDSRPPDEPADCPGRSASSPARPASPRPPRLRFAARERRCSSRRGPRPTAADLAERIRADRRAGGPIGPPILTTRRAT